MKQHIDINREEIDITAGRYFFVISGLEENGLDSNRMRKEAYAARAKLEAALKPRALVRSFGREVLRENGLFIEGYSFPCRALSGLEKENVLCVYAFVLTVGELPDAGQSILETLYNDFWGTAYANAAGETLQRLLLRHHAEPAYISGPIAPGTYGMDIKKIPELFQITDGNEIGVHLHDSMMEPVKSCAGFYLVVKSEAQLNFMNERCSYCHKGSGGGCAFCCYGKKHNQRGRA